MKRIYSFLFVFLILISLVGCKDKNENITPTPIPSEIVVNDEITLKGEILDRYSDINASDISKFLATAIVGVRPEEYQKNDFPIISEEDENAKVILSLMHLNPEILEEYAISTSLNNTRAYTVAIIKAVLGYEEDVLVSLSSRISDLNRELKNYPDQVYLINNVKIEQVGDYIVMVLCDNQNDVFDVLYKVMETTNLEDIKVVPSLTDVEREKIEEDAYIKDVDIEKTDIEDVIVTPVEEQENEIDNPENQENLEDVLDSDIIQ